MSAGEESRGVAGDTGTDASGPKEEASAPGAPDPKEKAGTSDASDPKEEANAPEAPDPKEKAGAPETPDPKEAGASGPPDSKGKAGASETSDPREEAGAPETPDPKAKASRVGFGVPELPEAKRMERLHCAGRQVPSPVGGFVMALGVRQEEDRTSTILFECKTSALRYELPMRVSGWRERRKVRIQVEEGLDPLCPRAELGPPLVRRGKDFYCPRCNIWFGRVP